MSLLFDRFGDIELFNIAMYLPLLTVFSYSRVNKRLYNLICNNDFFWKCKFFIDYKGINYSNNWKKTYMDSRSVWTFGECEYGKLGLEKVDDYDVNPPDFYISAFFDISKIADIKAEQIAAGGNHSLIISIDNSIWSFGRNDYGQLGLNDFINRKIPTKVHKLKAKKISAGMDHSVVISTDNSVWVFGKNWYEQSAVNPHYINKPIKLCIKAKQICAGGYHTILIDLNDDIWSFGNNYHGQLGLGDKISRKVPIKINGIKGSQISAGYNHTIIIDLNNNVWSFGNNDYGQLGLEDYENRYVPTLIAGLNAKKVSASGDTTVIIDSNDNVWHFGNNYTKIKIPIKAKKVCACGNNTMIIDFNNDLWEFKPRKFINNLNYTLKKIQGIKVTEISAGSSHNILIGFKEI